MKVVQVGVAYVGAQKQIEKNIHDYILSKGDESYILFANGNTDDNRIIKYETSIAYVIRKLLNKLFPKKDFVARISSKQLIRRIEMIRPDIIHLHVLHHCYLDWKYFFDYLTSIDIPVVITIHDMWSFTGGCYHYHTIDCKKCASGCKNCPASDGMLDCRKEDTNINYEKKASFYNSLSNLHFVAVSDWVEKEVKTLDLKYDTRVIYNSIDNPLISAEVMTSQKFRIIGVAANWTEKKGINRFFELAKMLDPKKYEIVLVGNVCDEIKQVAPDGIIFAGKVNDKVKLNSLFRSSNIHISMSLEETFGMTFIEAAMNGIKSIGFDSTAIPDVLRKINGYIVPPCDLVEMVHLIENIRNEKVSGDYTKNEIANISDLFSKENMASKYYSVYEEATSMRLIDE